MKTKLRAYRTLLGSLFVGLMATQGAFAQGPAPASDGAKAVEVNTNLGWFKLCETNKETKAVVCALNIQARNEKNQPIAQVRVVEQKGVDAKVFTVILPPGLLIQPGMRIQVDKANLGTAKFTVCTRQACVVEARMGKSLITSLKRGNSLNIIGIGQDRKQAGFEVTLAGFTAAYDGPPIDPKVLAEKTETLQQKLQRKADEARQRLLEQKKQDGEAAPN